MILYMVDTETTGLDGGPSDLVLDIGIVEIDTDMRTVAPVYSEVVGYDVSEWSDRLRDSWIFSHSDLTPEMVSRGKPLEEVVAEVRGLLDDRVAVVQIYLPDGVPPSVRRALEDRCRGIIYTIAENLLVGWNV